MDSFNRLADLFRQFPGIGPRQAKRFVYFLLSREPAFAEKLGELVGALKKEIRQCVECFRFFQRSNGALCPICADPNRATGELMVVAKDVDLEAIEKSGTYGGRYFVLGGTLPLLESKSPGRLRTKELLALVERASHLRQSASVPRTSASLEEIILALSANPEGEHTSDELRRLIAPTLSVAHIKLSTLGRGLSTGSELEYADKETIQSALKGRG